MKRTTREWVKKAEDDYRAAELLEQGDEGLHDQLCFLCQQCAEKYLKALVEEFRGPIEKTHDLDVILNGLLPHHPTLRSLRRGLAFLTSFAVGTRYPGRNASKRQSTAAMRWARQSRDACRAILGVRSRRHPP